MTPKQKAVDQYIRDKHTQDECLAYIQGWEDAYMEGYNVSEEKAVKALYIILALGIFSGVILTLIFTLI
jgi:hypothetical protein